MAKRNALQAGKLNPSAATYSAIQLRCWQDDRGALHLGSNIAGARLLSETVARLRDASRPTEAVLPMSAEPFVARYNPMSAYGVRHIFTTLHLKRIDDSKQVQVLYAHARTPEVAEILIGVGFIATFWDGVSEMIQGRGDYSIGPSRSDRWKFTSLDRLGGDLWCWGERNTHNTNTFRKG